MLYKNDIIIIDELLYGDKPLEGYTPAWERIKKVVEEAQNTSTSKQSIQGCAECGCNISLKGYCSGCQTRVD